MIFLRKIFYFCLFLSFITFPNTGISQKLVSQDSLYLLSAKSFLIKGVEVQIDQLGNFYVITASNVLEKYNAEGILLLQYSQNRLGNISQIDVSNPMQILVFYEDFQKIIFLDRNLSHLTTLDLKDWNIGWAKKVAMSSDGNIWIYDEITLKLQKYATSESKLMYESTVMSRESKMPPSASNLVEQNNQVYLADFRQGIFIFDQFGAILRYLPIEDMNSFDLQSNFLIYTTNKGTLHIENLLSFANQEITLPNDENAYYKVKGMKLIKIGANIIEISQISGF
jgi:hypothetical protein